MPRRLVHTLTKSRQIAIVPRHLSIANLFHMFIGARNGIGPTNSRKALRFTLSLQAPLSPGDMARHPTENLYR